ncbi:MAG: hypothetical protein KAI33_11045 [Elusimicrobiales bacterium]|nr:hypothetical protein [Elusimicrobiales bacterium]
MKIFCDGKLGWGLFELDIWFAVSDVCLLAIGSDALCGFEDKTSLRREGKASLAQVTEDDFNRWI